MPVLPNLLKISWLALLIRLYKSKNTIHLIIAKYLLGKLSICIIHPACRVSSILNKREPLLTISKSPKILHTINDISILNLSKTNLKHIPNEIKQLVNLTSIDLSFNDIQDLDGLNVGTSLENLILNNNSITTIENSFFINCTSLATLDVSFNQLKCLPYTLGLCYSLSDLRVHFNPFSDDTLSYLYTLLETSYDQEKPASKTRKKGFWKKGITAAQVNKKDDDARVAEKQKEITRVCFILKDLYELTMTHAPVKAVYSKRDSKFSIDECESHESENHVNETQITDGTKRDNVINEFISTELTYTKELETLSHLYVHPLKEILSPDDHHLLFSTIDEIRRFHNEKILPIIPNIPKLLSALENATPLYSPFLLNFENSITLLTSLETTPNNKSPEKQTRKDFKTIVDRAKTHPKHAHQISLYGFLILPVQRLPRYKLLTTQLLKHTPSSHSSYACVKSFEGFINKFISHCNTEKNIIHQQTIQTRIFSLIKPSFPVSPTRRFIKEGVYLIKFIRYTNDHGLTLIIKKNCKNVTGALVECGIMRKFHLFIFDDLLIIASKCNGGGMEVVDYFEKKGGFSIEEGRISVNGRCVIYFE